jgi:hypothetical protein
MTTIDPTSPRFTVVLDGAEYAIYDAATGGLVPSEFRFACLDIRCRHVSADAAQQTAGLLNRLDEGLPRPVQPAQAPADEACGVRFVTADRALVCARSDRHLFHRDAATGARFARMPFGAFITPAKHRAGAVS